jgi:hypothetical protein
MVVNRGGLLASTGAIALMAARSWRARAPEGEGEGAGGGGSGAGDEDEDFFGGGSGEGDGSGDGTGDGSGDGTGDGSGDGTGEGEGGELEIPEWAKSFSADKPGEKELSNQEWIAKLKLKDLDSVVQLARDNQKALRESGRVKLPGDGATEAEVKAYKEAVGAPLEASGYAVDLPAEAKGFELDTAFIDPMKEIAAKYHIPAAAFKELGERFMAAQLESIQADGANNVAERNATLKEWGPSAEQGKEEFRRGLDALGLKAGDAKAIEAGFGAKRTLELFRKIGQMAGEDFFAGNGGRPSERFGVSSAEEAKKQIDAMVADPETRKKIRAKDPVTSQRYNRLTEALANFRAQAAKAQ